MIALLLQVAGLVGLPVGAGMVAGWGGSVVGMSVVLVYVGLAVESDRH